MGIQTAIKAAIQPLYRSKGKRSATVAMPPVLDGSVADELHIDRRPLLTLATEPGRHGSSQFGYGATSSAAGLSSAHSSPERHRGDSLLGRVVEEEVVDDDERPPEVVLDDWDLEERGFYRGSYKRKMALYTFVPISSLLAFIFLALLPSLLWHNHHDGPPMYSRYFMSPLPELLLSASLWCLSYLLRFPLFNTCAFLFPSLLLQAVSFNVIHVLLSQFIRLSALPILRIRHEMQYPLPTWRDSAFYHVWWIALGWALADVTVGITQGYAHLALYKEVMVPEDRVQDLLTQWRVDNRNSSDSWTRRFHTLNDPAPLTPRPGQDEDGQNGELRQTDIEVSIKLAIDNNLEQLINLKDREELEEVYGIPPIKIPVFVSCLQRLDTFVLSLGLTLVLAASYLRSRISFPLGDVPPIYTNKAFAVAFPAVVVLQLFLGLLHTPFVLHRIGIHSAAYVALLLGLSSVFAGLGLWGALS